MAVERKKEWRTDREVQYHKYKKEVQRTLGLIKSLVSNISWNEDWGCYEFCYRDVDLCLITKVGGEACLVKKVDIYGSYKNMECVRTKKGMVNKLRKAVNGK